MPEIEKEWVEKAEKIVRHCSGNLVMSGHMKYQQEHIAQALQSAAREAREKAIDECAAIAENKFENQSGAVHVAGDYIASAIRDLKAEG